MKRDGGPAFSRTSFYHDNGNNDCEAQTGMALRDYFAAAALSGLVTDRELDDGTAATWAYRYADAMLKVREVTR